MPQIAQILFAHEMRGCSQPVVVIVPRQLSPLPKSRIQRKKPAKFKEFGVYPRSQNATPCPNATKEMCCVRHDLFNHERRGCMSALVNPAEWRPSRAMNAVDGPLTPPRRVRKCIWHPWHTCLGPKICTASSSPCIHRFHQIVSRCHAHQSTALLHALAVCH